MSATDRNYFALTLSRPGLLIETASSRGIYDVVGFPTPEETTTIVWQQAQQNFGITAVRDTNCIIFGNNCIKFWADFGRVLTAARIFCSF